MKKILFILICFTSIGTQLKAQDTISAQDFTITSNIPDTAWMWFWWGGTDYRIQGQYLSPLKYYPGSTPYLYTRNTDAKLLLGTTSLLTGYTTYPLQVSGNARITGRVSLYDGIYFDGGGRIQALPNDIYFYSPNYGGKTLSQIMSGSGSGSGFDNGLSIGSQNNAGLGGTILRNTNINIMDKNFILENSGSNIVRLRMYGESGIMQLYSSNDMVIQSNNLQLYSNNKWEFRYGSDLLGGTEGIYFTDKLSNPVGIQYTTDYSANIVSQDANEALVTYRLLKQFASDSIEQQISVSGSNRQYKVAAFSSDTNNFVPTNMSYSNGTLNINSSSDTAIHINTSSSYPAININSTSDEASVINVNTTNGGYAYRGTVTGTQGGYAFNAEAACNSSVGVRIGLQNYSNAHGLRIVNSSTSYTTDAINITQSSNYPNIFNCPTKFKIDGRGTPYIRDTSLYAWVAAHGGGGGSGNLVSSGLMTDGNVPYFSGNDTVTDDNYFKYYGNGYVNLVDDEGYTNIYTNISTSDEFGTKYTGLQSVVSTISNGVGVKSNVSGTGSIAFAANVGRGDGLTIYKTNASPTYSDTGSYIRLKAVQGLNSISGYFINIEDNPTTASSITSKILSATIDGTLRMQFYPRVANGTTTSAYKFDTDNNLTSNSPIFTIDNQGVNKLTVKNDTIITKKCLKVTDSLYLTTCTKGAERWLGVSRQGAVFSDSLVNAGFMLVKDIPSIKEHLSDQEDGEISWYYKDEKGNIIKTYGLAKIGRFTYQAQALMSAQEQAFRYIGELEDKLAKEKEKSAELEKRISVIEQILLKNSLK